MQTVVPTEYELNRVPNQLSSYSACEKLIVGPITVKKSKQIAKVA